MAYIVLLLIVIAGGFISDYLVKIFAEYITGEKMKYGELTSHGYKKGGKAAEEKEYPEDCYNPKEVFKDLSKAQRERKTLKKGGKK